MVGCIYMIHTTSTPCYRTTAFNVAGTQNKDGLCYQLRHTCKAEREHTWEAQRIVWNAEGNEKEKMIDLKRKQ